MIYVMSDIHGNLERFESIMRQINLKEEDTLYILGDVIDRYPYGIKLLRRIMKMPNVKMLLGNHEYMMLQAIGHCKDAADEKKNAYKGDVELWYYNGGDVTHDYLKHIRKEYRAEIFEYLKNLPLNYDVTVNDVKYKLVHASPVDNYYLDPLNEYEYGDEEYFAVWARWKPHYPIPVGYNLIFGHTPTIYFHNKELWEIWKDERAIGIDCGCGYEQGRLACLRLDDMKVFYSEK
ncbi:MAG: serine/threonine protein phosphatase [Ruminococcus sp.]|nr:serine/threonine protein phosphatase [Ruminococcus sp.]